MAEGHDLRREFGSRSEAGPNHRKESRNARTHDWVKSYQEKRVSSIATISTRFSVGTGTTGSESAWCVAHSTDASIRGADRRPVAKRGRMRGAHCVDAVVVIGMSSA